MTASCVTTGPDHASALDRAGHRHGRDHLATDHHRGTHRGHPELAFLDALSPTASLRFRVTRENLGGGASVHGKGGSDRDDRAKAVRRFQRDQADPGVSGANVELCALTRLVAEASQRRVGGLDEEPPRAVADAALPRRPRAAPGRTCRLGHARRGRGPQSAQTSRCAVARGKEVVRSSCEKGTRPYLEGFEYPYRLVQHPHTA